MFDLNRLLPLLYMAITTLLQVGVVLIGLALVVRLFARAVFRAYLKRSSGI
jgi:hypothetical protein